MGTSVASGSNLALTQYSTAVTAQIVRAPGNLNSMTGPAPKQADAEAIMKQQTSEHMPYVRITDLSTDPKGDKVTVDAFNVIGGKPIMGDRNAEGLGKPLSSSSFNVLIDLATFNVDAGGKMSRQRTRHDLRRIAKAELLSYFPRFIWQRAIVHLAGARGSQAGSSWDVPLATDADFADKYYAKAGATVQRYESTQESYLDLSTGRLDAIVGNLVEMKGGFLAKPEGKAFEFAPYELNDPVILGYGTGAAMRRRRTLAAA